MLIYSGRTLRSFLGTSGLNVATGGWRMTRSLWIGLAALMILTPWACSPQARLGANGALRILKTKGASENRSASHDSAPPAEAPKGLEQLSAVWTAPMPDYAPPFLKSKELGYIMSAMMGTGLIILAFLFFDAILA